MSSLRGWPVRILVGVAFWLVCFGCTAGPALLESQVKASPQKGWQALDKMTSAAAHADVETMFRGMAE